MELRNEFAVALDIDKAWAVLTDIEQRDGRRVTVVPVGVPPIVRWLVPMLVAATIVVWLQRRRGLR